MTDKSRYIIYTTEETTTVEEFLSSKDSLVVDLSKDDFLAFEDEKSESNLKKIYKNYSKEEKEDNEELFIQGDLSLLKINTPLIIPLSEYQEELFIIKGEDLFLKQEGGLKAFFSERQNELQSDLSYVRLESITQKGGDLDLQIVEENCQVWIYVKSIDKIVDVSPFINNINITKTDVGAFSINLNPIEMTIDRESDEIKGVFVLSNKGREYLNTYEIKNPDNTINQSFFDKYMQQNDVVFIRFEKLKLEESINTSRFGINGLEISKGSLPDQIFDMIGLVDNVSSNVSSETTDYSVNISGRDFMKVFIEDGSYLMDIIYARGAENILYFLGDENSKYFKRNFANNGTFEYLFTARHSPISTYLGFIINQLSNVGYIGDSDLFDLYANRRKTKYKIGITDEQRYLDRLDIDGVWKIIKLFVDTQIEDRVITDDSFIHQDGTIYEQFKKVCQEPFVEIWGDTYGSEFNLIAKQQPFDKAGMADIINTPEYIIDVEEKDTYQVNLGWETEFYSWFQLYPNNEIYGNDPYFLAATFPIIYLDKYVEHFGNHKKIIEDIYVSGRALGTSKSKENKEKISEAIFNDLQYIVESLSVLPFTRKGTVVINGDRRIKRGSFIRLKATGEICYVDAVSNDLSFSRSSVERTTTLSLKRCMIETFISENWIPGTGKFSGSLVRGYTYYDIVNTELIVEDLRSRGQNESQSKTTQTKTNFGVNEDAFNFFLQRRQKDLT